MINEIEVFTGIDREAGDAAAGARNSANGYLAGLGARFPGDAHWQYRVRVVSAHLDVVSVVSANPPYGYGGTQIVFVYTIAVHLRAYQWQQPTVGVDPEPEGADL